MPADGMPISGAFRNCVGTHLVGWFGSFMLCGTFVSYWEFVWVKDADQEVPMALGRVIGFWRVH